MTRADGDTWDHTDSVGAPATCIAMARAVAEQALLPFLPPTAQDQLLDQMRGAGDAIQLMADRIADVARHWQLHGSDA